MVIHTLNSSAISNGEGITEQNNINMKVVLVVSCEFVQTHLSSFVNSLFTRELSWVHSLFTPSANYNN